LVRRVWFGKTKGAFGRILDLRGKLGEYLLCGTFLSFAADAKARINVMQQSPFGAGIGVLLQLQNIGPKVGLVGDDVDRVVACTMLFDL